MIQRVESQNAAGPLPWTPVKIGWLSGVSRPGSSALSPDQLAFVESLPGEATWKLWTNFPYRAIQPANREAEGTAFRRTPLPIAWIVNLARFARASLGVQGRRTARSWRELRESCDLLLLITNSCGSQIVSALEGRQDRNAGLRILSLGPVDWGCPNLVRQTLRGSEDVVRVPFTPPADVVIDRLGHLDYAASSEVRALAHDWVERRLAEFAGEAP